MDLWPQGLKIPPEARPTAPSPGRTARATGSHATPAAA